MTRPRTVAIAALIGAAALLAATSASPVEPTSAAWVDAGRTLLSVTANDDPPPLTPPVTSEHPDTIITGGPDDWTWTSSEGPSPLPNNFCVQFQITSPSTDLVPWRVTLHLGVPPFNWSAPFTSGMIGSIYFPAGYYSTLSAAPGYVTDGLVYMTPDPFNSEQLVSATHPVDAKFCTNVPDPPWQPEGPTSYTVTSATLDVPTGYNPCVTVVVTGHQPFFVGFTANFDYKTIIDAALAGAVIDQVTYDRWLPLVTWAGPTASGATGANYLVTFTGYSSATRNVDQFTPVTLQSCAY
ncbi:hypothetical protein ASF62_05790 [Leifsonia sp. Leaf325]|nr:hypothetical protein [Leifsonia sp. Leaf325]KQQ93717.1 hypothetical protein ASF62_05790 [Leifsonia sp. Leaf325]